MASARNATPNPEQEKRAGLTRVMSPQMAVYYTNCMMVATTPKDVSILFGRYVTVGNEKGEPTLSELYERQVYMTFQQAEELAQTLDRTLKALKSRDRATTVTGEQS